jgi:hypothetical protein
MSRRNTLKRHQVLAAVNSTSTQTSEKTDITGLDKITYEFLLDLPVNALLEVQVSNVSAPADADFLSLNFNQTLSLIGSSNTTGLVHISNEGFKWLRLKTSNNGGTGNVSAWISGTSRGA